MYFEKKKYKKGDILYAQSDQPNGFYLIVSGEIQLSCYRQEERKPKDN
jgi:CRP-like cAMP-binding protein